MEQTRDRAERKAAAATQPQAAPAQAAPTPFAASQRPQSASALTGAAARDGSAALSEGSPDLSRTVASAGLDVTSNLKSADVLGAVRVTGSLVPRPKRGTETTKGGRRTPLDANGHSPLNGPKTNVGGDTIKNAGTSAAEGGKGKPGSGARTSPKAQGTPQVAPTNVIATAVTGSPDARKAEGPENQLSETKGPSTPIRSSLEFSGASKIANASTVAAALVGGGSILGKGSSLMRPQGPARPTKATAREVSAEVAKSARLAAYGDYGFVGTAARVADQTAIFSGSKARSALDAIGSSKFGKLAENLDKGIARAILDDGSGGERPHDANMADRMAKQTSRSAKRATKSGLKVALQGGSALDIAKESAIGAADDGMVDGARSAWRTDKNVKKVVKKGRELLRKRQDPSFRGIAEKFKKNPVDKLSESIKHRYAQSRSMSIKRAMDAGRTVRGMTTGQRVNTAVRAVANGISKLIAKVGAAILKAIAGASPALLAVVALLLVAAPIIVIFGGAAQEERAVENENLPAEVLQWDADATRIGNELGMGEWKPLILAMMAQESGGNPNIDSAVGARGDIMQAAEGAWGWVVRNGASPSDDWPYSKVEGGTPQASLYAGYLELKSNLSLFGVKDPSDIQGVKDVVQGYNFGANSWHSWLTSRNAHYSYDEAYAFAAHWVSINGRISSIAPGYGNPDHANMVMRYYSTNTGGGQEYSASSDQQKAIVDAAHSTPSPGPKRCAEWVSRVYNAAGLGYPGGNANNMYWNYCWSSDPKDLKVGMIVAVSSHGSTSAGRQWGHVAIYVGDGMVMENVGNINTQPLDKWIRDYGDLVTPKWGFAGGVAAN